jgi:predicted PurR-regulated permease PerM
MKNKISDKLLIIIPLFALAIFVIYQIRFVLSPFIVSMIIAYFLHPLVDKMQLRYKIPRTLSTLLILLIFFSFLFGLFALTIPLAYQQTLEFFDNLPKYIQILSEDIYPKIIDSLNHFGLSSDKSLGHFLENYQFDIEFSSLLQKIFINTISSSASLINILSVIFIMPILVFYLLKDWDRLINNLNNNLPSKISQPIRQLASKIDKTLAGFIRGQIHVCLILGFIYALLLSFCKLDYGFLIGILTGIFSFIPFVGMLCGVTIAIIIALFQWGLDFQNIALISGVFIFGQIIESNFLTPNLIGSKIGLHPVWIIFGLFFFGTIFGFFGIILAVPLSAVSAVIIKFLISNYTAKKNES